MAYMRTRACDALEDGSLRLTNDQEFHFFIARAVDGGTMPLIRLNGTTVP